MKYLLAVALLALAVGACGKKEEPEVVPPGFCNTQTEFQPVPDRHNAYQIQLREQQIAQGIHMSSISPTGKYKTTKAPNSYWNVTRETAGCPATASQQDPHPDPSKAKQSKH